jgi:GxxExxY protein
MGAAEGTEAEESAEVALNRVSGSVIGAAIDVHKALGPGLLESAYEDCLERELVERGHHVERQRTFPVVYKGAAIGKRLRLDMVVDDRVLVEIKAVKHVLPVHEAQILSYLRLSGLPLGLLINFHCATLIAGLRRFRSSVPSSPSVPSANQRKEMTPCPQSKRNSKQSPVPSSPSRNNSAKAPSCPSGVKSKTSP